MFQPFVVKKIRREVLTFIVKCLGKKPLMPNKYKMASCSSQSVLPILLDNSGFGNRKFCVKLVLDEKQLLETTEINVEDIAEDKEKKEFLKKDAKAKSFKPKEKLGEHFLRFDSIGHDLENAGAKMDDTDKICHLLLTMGDNFNTVITSIETMKQDLTIERDCWHNKQRPGKTKGTERKPLKRNETPGGPRAHQADISFTAFSCEVMSKDNIFILDSGAINHLVVGSLEEYMLEIRTLPHSVVIKTTNGGEMIATRAGKLMGDYGTQTHSKNSVLTKGLLLSTPLHTLLNRTLKAERMNLTLMNKVRTKFAGTDLPHTLWGKAVHASAYELNRSPTSALQNRTPASVWFGENDLSKLRRDVTFNESKVGVGNDTARYQGINTEEENEHLNGKDSTEVKTDTEENKTKEITKHGKEKNKISKPNRTIKKPSHLQEYELYMAYCLCAGEPQDYEGAIKLGNGWEEAIESEIKALELHKTWTPIVLPPGENAIETKWIFKTKKDGLKKITNHSSPDIYCSIKKMGNPTTRHSYSFLNEYVDDDIYIKTPDGVKNEPEFHNFMETHGMKRSVSDFCLYIGENVWLIIWVDDMLVTGERTQVENLIRLLKGEFKAKDLGILSEFLGTMILNDGDEVKISQSSFINKILPKFNVILCKGVNTPMVCDFQVDTEEPVNEKFMFQQLIGSLMYVATVSRPDISYSVCYLSRFFNKHTEQLWKAGKRVLRYLQQTQDLCLTFKPSSDDKLVCYSDSNWTGDKLDRKSVSRCVLLHGQNTISWRSRKQGTVALSSAEAEYIACATVACDLVYLQGVLQDFQFATSKPVLLADNQSAIDMAESFENSRRSHHIDVKFHYLKDLVDKKRIKINYVSSENNSADIMTKVLCQLKFEHFRNQLNVK
ncbi:hypothetical protein PR048_025852 [Dryococelus australis]|uniref:Reverse transcriptase Ty1/copia-type domain-containing protein n=1 Tax=Dryococelus australis TaxID=614101 RepID=A0ABQ9GJP8_9NEOP|nr:hypothetical protein PR048_025852 [Dryococelus australis]